MVKILSATVFFLIIGYGNALAQFGVQVSYIAPDGSNIYVFKPSIGVEIKYTTGGLDTNSRARFGFSVGYYKMNPTQDTFPNYKVANNKLWPGYDVVKDYSVVPIGAGIEYHPFEGKLTPYVGMDVDFFIINFSYHSYVETQYNDDRTVSDWALGAMPKIGITYQSGQNWVISAGIGYSLQIAGSSGVNSQSYLKPFIGISYYFKK